MAPLSELRLAQATIALAGCVPVLAGTAGILLGPALTGAAWDPASDSHFRYLSGLLLGIGLAFWSCIPALPHQTNRFRLLAAIVILGGLARLLALPLYGWPGTPMAAALVMELAVVPLLCLWQARLARSAMTIALLASVLLFTGQSAMANDPAPGPNESLRIGPVDPEWLRIAAGIPPNVETDESRLARAHPGRILRWGSLLALRLDNGRFVWLQDMHGPPWGIGSSEQYWLQDYWPDPGLYIVGIQIGRRSEHWLISRRTAEVTRLNAAARRDPADPRVFVTAGSATMGATAAEVWEGEGETWFLRYRCDNLKEDAEFLRWDGPGRAILAARDPRDRTREFVLTKTNGKWNTDACRDP